MQNSSPLEQLRNIGFKEVGEWLSESGKIKFTLDEASSSRNILYAFSRQDTIVYIGKTVQSLKQRMTGYKNPGLSQSTNIKCNKLIVESLLANNVVTIFALPDNGLLYFGGFHINLAAGLEDSLIKSIKPEWNRAGI